MDMILVMETFRQKERPVGIAGRLKMRMEALGMSQADLARKSGVMPSQLGRYLKDTKPAAPSAEVALKLAWGLDTSVEYLLGVTDNPEPFPNMDSVAWTLYRAWQDGDIDTIKAIVLPRLAQAFRDNPDLLSDSGSEETPPIKGK